MSPVYELGDPKAWKKRCRSANCPWISPKILSGALMLTSVEDAHIRLSTHSLHMVSSSLSVQTYSREPSPAPSAPRADALHPPSSSVSHTRLAISLPGAGEGGGSHALSCIVTSRFWMAASVGSIVTDVCRAKPETLPLRDGLREVVEHSRTTFLTAKRTSPPGDAGSADPRLR